MKYLITNKISVVKIIIFNTIPVIGFFVFNWKIFDIAAVYLIETFVIFMVFFIDRYFIVKETRYPLFFALIQLVFITPLITAIAFAYIILAFGMTEPTLMESRNWLDFLYIRLDKLNLNYLIPTMFLLESINFAIKRKLIKNHNKDLLWKNTRKLLIIHFYIIISLLILSILPANFVLSALFVIGFKILLDYFVDDEKRLLKLWHYISSSRK